MIKHQDAVINDLEPKAQKAVDKVRTQALLRIDDMWDETKDVMKAMIAYEYRRDFGGDRWSLGMARAKGTLLRIERHVSQALNDFHARSVAVASKAFRSIYHEGVMRHAWILDQVTPGSYDVKIPTKRQFQEAGVNVYEGSEAGQIWRDRWSNWLGAYQSALNQNIRLGAINESDAEEATGEVDATKAGTPAYRIEDALDRVFQYQAATEYASALTDLSDANPDMGITEIWQTRYNARVCDDCDSQRGMTMDEAELDIPAHPNCECYWRLVPESFAELLRSGNAEDRALAEQMDAEGLVPSGMTILKDGQDVGAKMIVSYERWSAGMPKVIGAGV